MVKVTVHRSGLFSSVQDYGRPQEGSVGVPWGGVMDRHSFKLANQLLGNNTMNAVLELTIGGPTLEFGGSVKAVITGADMSPKVNGKSVSNYEVFKIEKGDILSFGKLKNGCRAYLAFDQSIDVPLELSSKSTYNYAGLGGFKGRNLQKGDKLWLRPRNPVFPNEILKPLDIFSPLIVKAYTGPDFEKLTEEQREVLFSTVYKVGVNSNRMGVKLNGEPVSGDISGILSSGIVRGTVQLLPSGLPLILMADAPTTGGYLRVLVCTDLSVNQLAQLRTGDTVVFDLASYG